ncbi:MAG: diguanylate cyclase [Armatimonadota bacterium]
MRNDDFYKSLLDDLDDGVYFCDRERRITYWNRGAERISGFTASEVVGSHCCGEVLMHVDDRGTSLCTNGCALSVALTHGEPSRMKVYLRHKRGHRVPVEVRVTPLRDDDGRVVGVAEVFTDSSAVVAAQQHLADLKQIAYVDPLTGMSNRRHAGPTLRARLDELRRYGWQFAVLFLDVHRFKQINDRHGHEVGDQVLRMVGQTLAANCRSFDSVGRWGGEEFVAVLPNIDATELPAVAERFRLLVGSSELPLPQGEVRVTVSVGATLARPEDTPHSLVKRADELMYQSKAAGGDCVAVG